MNDYQQVPLRRPIRTRRPLSSRLLRYARRCFANVDMATGIALLFAACVFISYLLAFGFGGMR